MRFTIGPWVYRLRICPGPLYDDAAAVAAMMHERTILLSGTLSPRDRLEPLLDQLRRLHVKHYGAMQPAAVTTFTADVMRQLQRQGGEQALMRLVPGGYIEPGSVPDIAAEPVGCECGKCGTRYGAHQITSAGADLEPTSGMMIVRRCVECEFCGHLMCWAEGATSAGLPNGRVVMGPEYVRPHATSSSAARE